MARRCELLLLMLVMGASCRRPAPPPPPASAEPTPTPNPAPPPSRSAEAPPSTTGAEAEANAETQAQSKVDRTKSKEAEPAKSEPASARTRNDEAAARTRATRVATEEQRPKTKRAHAAKGADAPEGQVVAAREEVAAAASAEEAPARATLRFKNEAGKTYKLVEARFVMDGAELPTVITSAERGEAQQIFSGSLPAGRHVVASRLTYQGADRAIFSYMKGYTFHVKSDDEFVARSKNAISMTIVCKEKTGFNTPVERRLFVTVE
jgi:hypothetical protein